MSPPRQLEISGRGTTRGPRAGFAVVRMDWSTYKVKMFAAKTTEWADKTVSRAWTLRRTGESDELRYPAVLQRSAGDRCRCWRGGIVLSPDSAAVAGIPSPTPPGTDLARPASSGDGARPQYLGGPYSRPALSHAG